MLSGPGALPAFGDALSGSSSFLVKVDENSSVLLFALLFTTLLLVGGVQFFVEFPCPHRNLVPVGGTFLLASSMPIKWKRPCENFFAVWRLYILGRLSRLSSFYVFAFLLFVFVFNLPVCVGQPAYCTFSIIVFGQYSCLCFTISFIISSEGKIFLQL